MTHVDKSVYTDHELKARLRRAEAALTAKERFHEKLFGASIAAHEM